MSSALAEEHFPLAVWVVRDMTRNLPPGDSGVFEDLISCASVALVEVANRYDPAGGAKFATYAVPRIRGAILDELRRIDWASRSVRDGRRCLAKAEAGLRVELGRDATVAELASRLGLASDELERLRADVVRAHVIPLDGIVTGEGTAFDVPAHVPGPEELAIRREEHRHLRACVAVLSEQQREVLVRNFFGDESLTAIGADMGLTVGRVSQIRARALLLVRAALSHIWDGVPSEAVGGIRARREEEAFVGRAVERCSGTAA